MPAPLALAAPAALGLLAYANARASVSYDYALAKAYFFGVARVVYRERNDRLNLFYDLEYYAQKKRTANQPVLLYQGKTYTYAGMYDAVLRYGHWMRTEFGIKPGQVVAMLFDNSDTFAIAWFALWSIGAKPAFINFNLRGAQLAHCVKVSTAHMCFADADLVQHLEAIKGEVPGVRTIALTPDVQAKALGMPPTRAPDSERSGQTRTDMAVLIYTSGTTGMPKPAIVSWSKVVFGAAATAKLLGRGNGDTMYSAMPLYHSLASVAGLCSTVVEGSTFALAKNFSKSIFWDEVRATKATSILYIGEAMRYLLAAPPRYDPVTKECLDKKHNVQIIYGAGLRPDVWRPFLDRFGIDKVIEFYGSTEGTMGTWNVSSNHLSEGAVGRVGWLFGLLIRGNSEIVVVDWETDSPLRDSKTGFCVKANEGETGEMILKVPPEDIHSRFQGYFKNKDATEKKVLRDVFVKGDAWFRTGDSLRWGGDGRLYFSDRLGDTFRWKGENVSTMEVSHVMGLHPSIHEANVYGVQLPNHDGRAGCAAVTFDSGRPNKETLQALADYLKASLPRYAIPLFLKVVEEVGTASQTTGTHKQQKVSLREAGVKPAGDGAEMYWLKGGTYVPFGKPEWQTLENGQAKL